MDTISLLAVLVVGLALGVVLGAALGVLWSRSRAAYVEDRVDQAELLLGLDRLSDQMRDLDQQRASWQGQLHQQVLDMRGSTETLRRETQSLSTALRKPQVRGRWGELHLRRAVELAGMVDRCDFTEQTRLADGALRPDLVVRLVGGRTVVVDSKVPLDAYLDATSTDDDDERATHLARHARQVRNHVEALGGKAYWRALPETPEFVVLFLPAESFLAAALEADPGLLEHAATRQVVLATPTTLIALLRTVAHGWGHEALAVQAREIHRLGRELHGRLATMVDHFDRVGRSLNAAVGHYNQAVGSLETRVLVSARRFEELSVTDAATDGELPAPRSVELHAVERRGSRDGPDPGRTLAGVTAGRTLWEEGHEPGRRVVALGLALALTVVVLDVQTGGGVGILFDVCFVAVCVTVALVVRPEDFFTVGVLPPLIMLTTFVVVAASDRNALTPGHGGLVATVVTGLAHHAVALGVGYALSLGCLAVRGRFVRARI